MPLSIDCIVVYQYDCIGIQLRLYATLRITCYTEKYSAKMIDFCISKVYYYRVIGLYRFFGYWDNLSSLKFYLRFDVLSYFPDLICFPGSGSTNAVRTKTILSVII